MALGMLPMCSPEVGKRLKKVLVHWALPTEITGDLEKMLEIAAHDKKRAGDSISVVWVEQVGSCEIRKMPMEEFKAMVRKRLAASV